jgi:precorrin-6B C5,15-methyltransferase / cobalt-precorrin-6B C5,C15-methyltransferase
MSAGQIIVVGIGADGWTGLSAHAQAAVLGADQVIASARQLELLPEGAPPRRPWPSPIAPLVDELVAGIEGRVCVLASGDPMLHGIGATLARRVDPGRLQVIAHPSAFALACARLGWPEAEVTLVSTVGRPPATVARILQDGRRAIVYGGGGAEVAQVARAAGYGPSRLVVLEQLGGPREQIVEATADTWGDRDPDSLHVIALECVRAIGARLRPLVPGLPDESFAHDGALTKRHVRAATLAALAPTPGALLWDIGAGSGSIAIEWLRAEPTARAVAVEPRADRAERITANAARLGVPSLTVVGGRAPEALAGLEPPQAAFIGGGLATPGLLDAVWEVLTSGGRLVANAVTLEGEHVLVSAHAERGGDLTRIEVSHAEPIGGLTTWRPALPIVQWSVEKP